MPELLPRRAEMVGLCQALDARGWVANHNGNVSLRLGPDRFLVTPSGLPKRDITLNHLIVVDGAGRLQEGHGKVFSEWPLHARAYAERDDIDAVLHAHTPYASALAAAHMELPAPFQAEAVVALGAEIPLIESSLPFGPDAGVNEALALRGCHALLMAGHGPLVVGRDLEQVLLRLELLEELARTEVLARALGGTRPLDGQQLAQCLDKHQSAGLAPGGAPLALATDLVRVDGQPPMPPVEMPQSPAASAWMGEGEHVRSQGACAPVYGRTLDKEEVPPVDLAPSALPHPQPRRPTAEELRTKVDQALRAVLGT